MLYFIPYVSLAHNRVLWESQYREIGIAFPCEDPAVAYPSRLSGVVAVLFLSLVVADHVLSVVPWASVEKNYQREQ